MNRWNPNRKEIVYYLSDEFGKPENKLVKDLTYKTVENLNAGLAQAGVSFHINLKDPAGKVPGDIRNSMIVLVEDPVASSVIGYGPQTEDPVTGEIISARTVMFLGTIKKYIKYTYDEILREKVSQANASSASNVADRNSSKVGLDSALSSQISSMKNSNKVIDLTAFKNSVLGQVAAQSGRSASLQRQATGSTVAKDDINKIMRGIRNYTANKNQEYSDNDAKTRMRYMQEVKNCAFVPAIGSAAGGISKKLIAMFEGETRTWDKLSDPEKEVVIAKILPEIWVPTLIHEMGHNLGLRHNFAASEDKANYPTQEELQAMGSDHAIPFSSVMDYGNDLKTLPVLGSYDIAALKFGYLRQVQVSGDSTFSTVDDTLENLQAQLTVDNKQLKEYKYCTDENTGINAGCKRFDLGSTYTEIAQNLIKDYEDAYKKRNFRDGRASMSLMDDLKYADRISSTFKELRLIMETMERIQNRTRFTADAKEWDTDDFLKDVRQATLLSGIFFANVLLVPDATCAIAKKDTPNAITIMQPLSEFKALSCFDVQLKEEYVMVGQAGKRFNSFKDPANPNAYADEIDVRGIWLDKVLALRALTNRQIGISSLDEFSDNFLNIKELRAGILGIVKSIMNNNVVNTVPFTMADGSKADLEMSYDMSDSQVVKKPLILDVLEHREATADVIASYAAKLGVRVDGTTPLQHIIASQLVSDSIDHNDVHVEDKQIAASMSVYKFGSIFNINLGAGAKSVVIDNTVYVADSSNTLAGESIDNLALATTVEKVPAAKLVEIIAAKAAHTAMPADATADEQAVWNLSDETIKNVDTGVLKKSSYYKQLLNILPTAR